MARNQLKILVVIRRCRTVNMKDNIIKVCEQRGDSHAVEVSSIIIGVITDLDAADAR